MWSATFALLASGYAVALPSAGGIKTALERSLLPRWETAKVTPCTVVLDGETLVDTKLSLRHHTANQSVWDSYHNLITAANTWMDSGPYTVLAKGKPAPNGTIQDYTSQAPYFWPANWNNSASNVTCPYVNRDGIRNPEVNQYPDKFQGINMFNSSYLLSLAWYYSDDDAYRVQAAGVLRTWFVNNYTRMNPNLDHAQLVPCANDGRSIGIIDFSQSYTSVVDAAAILGTVHDGIWSQADDQAFRDWNSEFLVWLTNSTFGKQEANNHGTFAVMQIAAIASYLGKYDLVRQTLQDEIPRIDSYIAPNGTQPLELARTRSFHYSTFDLVAYTRLVAIGRNPAVGVDLWNHVGSQGQSIKGALNYLIPYATGAEKWPWPELDFTPYAAYDILHAGAYFGDPDAQKALKKLQEPPGGGLWFMRPASEQLDNINVTG